MRTLTVNGIRIDDTFAEAFGMRATALVITADTRALGAAGGADDDRLRHLGDRLRLRGRHRSRARRQGDAGRPAGRARAAVRGLDQPSCRSSCRARVGQCVLTSPGSACYAGLDGEEPLRLGNALRYFGDGWQISKRLGGKHYWRMPVMDGEFVCEATTGLTKQAVGGGNLLIMGRSRDAPRWPRPRRPSTAIAAVPDVIMPFPGGIVRSGSKVGSKYKGVTPRPTTPIARRCAARSQTALDADVASVLEIVIDGLTSGGGRRRDARRPGGDRAARAEARARCASAPAITAASSGRTTFICGTCCREPAGPHLAPAPDQRLDLSPLVPHGSPARRRPRSSRSSCRPRARRSPSATSFACARATPRTSASRAPATGSITSGTR